VELPEFAGEFIRLWVLSREANCCDWRSSRDAPLGHALREAWTPGAGRCSASRGADETRVQRSEPSPEHVDAEENRPRDVQMHPATSPRKGTHVSASATDLSDAGRCG
jgi:hypothetical protein